MQTLTEQFEMQTKNARKKVLKDFWFRQYPNLRNLGIGYDSINYVSGIKLIVTDLINIQEPPLETHALTTKPSGSTFLIDSIECPVCKLSAPLNSSWPVFICNSSQHPKKIFEIKKVSKGDQIPKFLTFDGEEDDYEI
jgi:hypothetical protein